MIRPSSSTAAFAAAAGDEQPKPSPAAIQTVLAWAILWRSQNRLDGRQQYLIGTPYHPCRTLLFDTRSAARAFIADNYGYMRERTDLRTEPFGWRMPIAVAVKIQMELA